MKIKFFLLGCLLLCKWTTYAQSVQYDFEDWQEFEIYDEPLVYETGNFQSYFITLGPNVFKTPGPKGNAIRLENKKALFDTVVVPGLIFLADLAAFPAGGIPYPYAVPDSLVLQMKYEIQPKDTGLFVMLFKRSGFPVSINVFQLFGSSQGYQKFSVPLMSSVIAPDSVVFVLSSGSLDNPVEGSYIELEEMAFTNTIRQLPNSDFENWETIKFSEPEGWATGNLLSAIFRTPPSVERSMESTNGQYALSVTQRVINKFGFVQNTGACFLGETASGIPTLVPFSANRFKLSFDYKYEPVGTDTAWLVLRGTRYDLSKSNRDTLVLMAVPLTNNTTFKTISLSSNPLTLPTDSMIIEVYPTNFYPGKSNGPFVVNNGSKLTVDNIKIVDPSSSKTLNRIHLTIGPNPAQNELIIEGMTNFGKLDIYNTEAKLVYSKTVLQDKIKIELSEFQVGMYLINYTTSQDQQVLPFYIQR